MRRHGLLTLPLVLSLLACGDETGGGDDGASDDGDDGAGDDGGSSDIDELRCTMRIEGDVELELGSCIYIATSEGLLINSNLEDDLASFEAAGIRRVSAGWQFVDEELAVGTYSVEEGDLTSVGFELLDGTLFVAGTDVGSGTLTLTTWEPGVPKVDGTVVATVQELTTEGEPRTASLTIEF